VSKNLYLFHFFVIRIEDIKNSAKGETIGNVAKEKYMQKVNELAGDVSDDEPMAANDDDVVSDDESVQPKKKALKRTIVDDDVIAD
jgi:hypothetical protein